MHDPKIAARRAIEKADRCRPAWFRRLKYGPGPIEIGMFLQGNPWLALRLLWDHVAHRDLLYRGDRATRKAP